MSERSQATFRVVGLTDTWLERDGTIRHRTEAGDVVRWSLPEAILVLNQLVQLISGAPQPQDPREIPHRTQPAPTVTTTTLSGMSAEPTVAVAEEEPVDRYPVALVIDPTGPHGDGQLIALANDRTLWRRTLRNGHQWRLVQGLPPGLLCDVSFSDSPV